MGLNLSLEIFALSLLIWKTGTEEFLLSVVLCCSNLQSKCSVNLFLMFPTRKLKFAAFLEFLNEEESCMGQKVYEMLSKTAFLDFSVLQIYVAQCHNWTHESHELAFFCLCFSRSWFAIDFPGVSCQTWDSWSCRILTMVLQQLSKSYEFCGVWEHRACRNEVCGRVGERECRAARLNWE